MDKKKSNASKKASTQNKPTPAPTPTPEASTARVEILYVNTAKHFVEVNLGDTTGIVQPNATITFKVLPKAVIKTNKRISLLYPSLKIKGN